jgi:hypothetical protein
MKAPTTWGGKTSTVDEEPQQSPNWETLEEASKKDNEEQQQTSRIYTTEVEVTIMGEEQLLRRIAKTKTTPQQWNSSRRDKAIEWRSRECHESR